MIGVVLIDLIIKSRIIKYPEISSRGFQLYDVPFVKRINDKFLFMIAKNIEIRSLKITIMQVNSLCTKYGKRNMAKSYVLAC